MKNLKTKISKDGKATFNNKMRISKDGNVTFWPKHMDDKMRVMEMLMHIEGWNQSDIDNCDDDIIFMGSLEARRDMIEELLKLVKKINKINISWL